jgi:hypothetical protein
MKFSAGSNANGHRQVHTEQGISSAIQNCQDRYHGELAAHKLAQYLIDFLAVAYDRRTPPPGGQPLTPAVIRSSAQQVDPKHQDDERRHDRSDDTERTTHEGFKTLPAGARD